MLTNIVQKISDSTLLDYLCLCHEKNKVDTPEYDILKKELNRRKNIQRPKSERTIDAVFNMLENNNEAWQALSQWDKDDKPP